MWSTPRGPSRPGPSTEISPIVASELATEYASLKASHNCPTGMYIIPSLESLMKWHGIFFVHRGPYGGSILRFSIIFPPSFPHQGPTIRFDADVFHPMVEPKTRAWHPKGRLAQWNPRVDHVVHLLHDLKRSFKTAFLATVMEDEAVNKHVWSLYHHSHQTFLSMTSQRALKSSSRSTLYPNAPPLSPTSSLSSLRSPPTSPTSIKHQRNVSSSSEPIDPGPIEFGLMDEKERRATWKDLERSIAR